MYIICFLKISLQNLPVKYNFHVAVQHDAKKYDHKDLKHCQPRRDSVLGPLAIPVASYLVWNYEPVNVRFTLIDNPEPSR